MLIDTYSIYLVTGALGSLILLAWLSYLTYSNYKLKEKLDGLLDNQDKDLFEIIEKYYDETKKVQKYAKKIEGNIDTLSGYVERSFQKVGFIRYNPFGTTDTGGNQSFSIALLNLKDNGFIITSIHSREGTLVYAKSVAKGKATNNLSKEEQEALNKALNKKQKEN